MLSRLCRARRVPLRRYLQTDTSRPTFTATAKYALAAGTFATAAFLGTLWNAQDGNTPSPDSSSRPDFETFLRQRLAEQRTTLPIEKLRPEPAQNLASPEPEVTQKPVQTEAEVETADGDANASAFNPETGEINWDCPCLGGMAHGPCGPEFREAFSCFVHSEDEPKGINCVERFQAMQSCFREHPETYASEIADDDAAEAAMAAELEIAVPEEKKSAHTKSESTSDSPSPPVPKSSEEPSSPRL
ncbi:hypothetical protein GGX14DRAFT_439094 [Mycena pura]|uniref:Mitochondrial intermembrane space import and assembly protein 40 n=1 Tax=Mycena pura TaxID=153505 RepID=A0AAD6VN21_9AGAR|nr:hypothetical protein GGX14DRAFT_439094 [Mycena pura]